MATVHHNVKWRGNQYQMNYSIPTYWYCSIVSAMMLEALQHLAYTIITIYMRDLQLAV